MRKKIMNNLILNGINVTSIDTSSGIFVGINNVNNWSSHYKSNHGFGSVTNSTVSDNFGLVIDNDVIDTPIESRAVTYMDGTQQVNNIDVKEINVNSLHTNAAVSIGDNLSNGWSAHGKRNEGMGRSVGTTMVKSNTNIVIDNDLIDSQIYNNNNFQ
ncbi:hypothetical protein [Bacillus sp. EB600]|uniref:hypothetical protein n=1 Tax=Bacillus sp. EB600 TaxID=2806345 RepID=UPI00210C1B8A|nr:hypothetical protein [Bacillus sp. EB600]MCQ6280774.1 hypothetical protein [Bacillus sp. EB600]